jgi:hippurate hydrolase
VQARTERILPELLELYRWFHAHPELSQEEKATADRLADELERLGLQVEQDVGGYGVVAVLHGGGPGPVVLYRADMDALPVQESTGLAFASQTPGVMHACGHDLHLACAVGALQVMSEIRDQWSGTVVFLGQPAEETGAGAKAMLADPKLRAIFEKTGPPILALALHDAAQLPAGSASLMPGYVTANVDSVDIIVHGVGGHGAVPDQAVDPIVIGAEIVGTLQTILSRKLPPGTPAVVTVGRFVSGSKRNIIPSTAELNLTVRSYEEETREKILTEIRRTAEGVAAAHGVPRPPEVVLLSEGTPAGYNDPAWVQRLHPAFQAVVGSDLLLKVPPGTIGEDFARYSRELKIPGVMFLLGAADPAAVAGGGALPTLHSANFAPDAPKALPTGVRLVVAALLEALGD